MTGQATPNGPSTRNKGLIKGLLTMGVSLHAALLNPYFWGGVKLEGRWFIRHKISCSFFASFVVALHRDDIFASPCRVWVAVALGEFERDPAKFQEKPCPV